MGPRHRWASAAFGIEAVLLLAAAALAAGSGADRTLQRVKRRRRA
jgi:hypothetical protein